MLKNLALSVNTQGLSSIMSSKNLNTSSLEALVAAVKANCRSPFVGWMYNGRQPSCCLAFNVAVEAMNGLILSALPPNGVFPQNLSFEEVIALPRRKCD